MAKIKVQKEGILQEVKKREFYEKPSLLKKRRTEEKAKKIYNERVYGRS